ncbi:MAG: hypothetical protein MZU95_08690 [Desulfomicrobium escambiense]|nr:hypothetical protein [Desulfomicrobium escambiense]
MGDPLDNPELASAGPGDEVLLARLAASQDYAEAIESVSYQEKFFSKELLPRRGTTNIRPVYVPLMDEEVQRRRHDHLPQGRQPGARGFDRLLLALAIMLSFVILVGAVDGPVLPGTDHRLRDPDTVRNRRDLRRLPLVRGVQAEPDDRVAVLSIDLWKLILSRSRRSGRLSGTASCWACRRLPSPRSSGTSSHSSRPAPSSRRRWKQFIKALATLPIISPPFSLTLSLILLFGNNGFITKKLFGIESGPIYGLGGLIAIQTLTMFTIAFSSIEGVLQAIDATTEEASMDLRAGKLQDLPQDHASAVAARHPQRLAPRLHDRHRRLREPAAAGRGLHGPLGRGLPRGRGHEPRQLRDRLRPGPPLAHRWLPSSSSDTGSPGSPT